MMIESFQHNGFAVEIHADEMPENPRDWDTLGTLVCFHRRYLLGDMDHGYRSEDFSGWDEVLHVIERDHQPVAVLPLYLFDHSGLSISADPERFRAVDPDGWDWGQIGFAFVSRENALREYGVRRLSPKTKARATQALLAEVAAYNHYVAGEVYGYVVRDADGMEVDSCWGVFGYEDVVCQAKASSEAADAQIVAL